MTPHEQRAEACDGSCQEHKGAVLRVQVWAGTYDWGLFLYCEEARQEDVRRGLTVEVVQ